MAVTKATVILLWALALVACDSKTSATDDQADNDLVDRYNLSSTDQYKIDVKESDLAGICSQSYLLADGFDVAKDTDNYVKWKQIQENDCKKKDPRRNQQ